MRDEVDLEVRLPSTTAAPQVARRALNRLCTGRVDGELLADAELMVSELASNALLHGDGPISLRACLDADRLLVEVVDQGSGFERELRLRNFQDVGGWGLEIIDERASRWGVHDGSSHVWFELELPGPRLGEPDQPA